MSGYGLQMDLLHLHEDEPQLPRMSVIGSTAEAFAHVEFFAFWHFSDLTGLADDVRY
jgi:hypothetical protein